MRRENPHRAGKKRDKESKRSDRHWNVVENKTRHWWRRGACDTHKLAALKMKLFFCVQYARSILRGGELPDNSGTGRGGWIGPAPHSTQLEADDVGAPVQPAVEVQEDGAADAPHLEEAEPLPDDEDDVVGPNARNPHITTITVNLNGPIENPFTEIDHGHLNGYL